MKRVVHPNLVNLVNQKLKKYGGHFAKIIKINKIKYILIYFNNENDMLQAIYRSTMDEDIGKGLQTKSQKELIGKDGVYRKTGINKFSVPTHTKSKENLENIGK
uniref:Uncharacterized protein n=1 Tax=Rhizophagus irregularis (strain DAOM 181602 / DAOM 197198 / MUCL 43194) TaxID=747089 RepID=U9U762_RHIID